ncbi:hypothetical protein QBC43DRAFT_331818 [Cladorrhinum sp. PSN259]|nr:hypothetical protein QBC43DRAFT_331818 [Cladorrhinum sp. PSN259]
MCKEFVRHFTCDKNRKLHHNIRYRHSCSTPPVYKEPDNKFVTRVRDFDCECEGGLRQIHEYYPEGLQCPNCTGETEDPYALPAWVDEENLTLKGRSAYNDRENQLLGDELDFFARKSYVERFYDLMRHVFINYNRCRPLNVENRYIQDHRTGHLNDYAVAHILTVCLENLVCPIYPEHGPKQTLQFFEDELEFIYGVDPTNYTQCNELPSVRPQLSNPAKFLRRKMAHRVIGTVSDPGHPENLPDGQSRLTIDNLALTVLSQKEVLRRLARWQTWMAKPPPEGFGRTVRDKHLLALPVLMPNMAQARFKYESLISTHYLIAMGKWKMVDKDMTPLDLRRQERRKVLLYWFALILATDTGLTDHRRTILMDYFVADFLRREPGSDEYFWHLATLPTREMLDEPRTELYFMLSSTDLREWTSRKMKRVWEILPRKIEKHWNSYHKFDGARTRIVKRNIVYAKVGDTMEHQLNGTVCGICFEDFHEHDTYNKRPCAPRACYEKERQNCWYNQACIVKYGRGVYPYKQDQDPHCPQERESVRDRPGRPQSPLPNSPSSDFGFLTSPDVGPDADGYFQDGGV